MNTVILIFIVVFCILALYILFKLTAKINLIKNDLWRLVSLHRSTLFFLAYNAENQDDWLTDWILYSISKHNGYREPDYANNIKESARGASRVVPLQEAIIRIMDNEPEPNDKQMIQDFLDGKANHEKNLEYQHEVYNKRLSARRKANL